MQIGTTRPILGAIVIGLGVLWGTAGLNAAELYSWVDGAGRLHITNIPALAPSSLRVPKAEAPRETGTAVIPPRPRLAPRQSGQTRADTQTRHLQKTIDQLEKRNESVKTLQRMLEQILNP